MFPRILDRRTNHKKTRYQLYYPGFNRENSCWLKGKWVTISKEEWEKTKDAHAEMYKNLNEDSESQHYRNPGIEISEMTEAQKKAWEVFSGNKYLSYVTELQTIGTCSVACAGEKVTNSQIKWLRRLNLKIIAKVILGGEIVDQTASLPDDVIHFNEEPIDPSKEEVVQKSKAKKSLAKFFELIGRK